MRDIKLLNLAIVLLCAFIFSLGSTKSVDAFEGYAFHSKWGSAGTDRGNFDQPIGLAIDPTSTFVYVVDIDDSVVQKCTLSGECPIKWGGEGTVNGKFMNPTDVDCDADGNVYVVDSDNFRIQKFDGDGHYLSAWGGLGSGNGQFANPIGIAVDRARGYVYVTDSASFMGGVDYRNSRVQKFDLNGAFISAWGSYGGISASGPPADGRFNTPWGIAVDEDGDVYVADTNNDRIQKFGNDGTHLITWGGCGVSDPDCSGTTAPGRFGSPTCIAIDNDKNVFVSDYPYNNIRKYSSDGEYQLIFGTPGGGDGQFNHHCGIAFDNLGVLYVADGDNHRIQSFRYVRGFPPLKRKGLKKLPSREMRNTPIRNIGH